MKILNGIWAYLKDWKNWLVHAIVGIALLVMLIWVPIDWWVKLIIIFCVICFNCVRMILENRKKTNNQQTINNNLRNDKSE